MEDKERIEDPKPPSTIPSEPRPVGKSKRLLLIGGVVLVAMIVLTAMIINNKSENTNSPTNPVSTNSSSEIIKQIESQMVEIKGGAFKMGSPNNEAGRDGDEGPQHQVTVSPFYMGKYEVTQEQWRAVAGLSKVKIDLNADPSNFKGDDLPIEQVSWEEAVEFCERVLRATGKTYRLPTEAEWEYACRGGTTAAYAGNLNEIAWCSSNSGSKTHPVGTKKANAWGLYDMHGNVWEWCSDWYSANYYRQSPSANPTGPDTGSRRVRRGGSWFYTVESLRSARRGGDSSSGRFSVLGFRLVRTHN